MQLCNLSNKDYTKHGYLIINSELNEVVFVNTYLVTDDSIIRYYTALQVVNWRLIFFMNDVWMKGDKVCHSKK